MKSARPLPRFEVEARDCGFQPEIDVFRLNQLNDDLEIEDFLRESPDVPSANERDELWFEEADRRQREVEEGRVAMVPGAEVMARLAKIG